MKPKLSFLFPALALLLLSCSSSNNDEIMTYKVLRGDFKHILKVNGFVESVRSTTISIPQEIDGFITFLIEDGSMVREGDTLCIVEDTELQSDYIQQQLNIEQIEGQLAKLIAANNLELALLQSQLLTNQADTKLAELDSLQLQYMPAGQRRIKELEMRTATLEREKIERNLTLTPLIQHTNVRKQEMTIQRYKRRLEDLEKRLAGLTMLAPQDGLAVRAEATGWSWGSKLKVGDNVWNGMPVVVMPDIENMKVKIWVSETQFKYIGANDSIEYDFNAMPGEKGFGKVVKKATMGTPIKRGSKVKMFEVEASLDSVSRMPDPGFTVDCHVMLTEQKDVVFIPQITVFSEDTIKVVYVKLKNGFEMRQVETGLSSPKEAVITTGLEGGEEIAFSRPKESMIRTRTLLAPENAQEEQAPEQAEEGGGAIAKPDDADGDPKNED